MNMNKLIQGIVVVVFVVGAFAFGSLWQKVQVLESQNTALKAAPAAVAGTAAAGVPAQPPAVTASDITEITARDHTRGNKNAKIAFIEYSDLECPYCKQFQPTMQQVMNAYQDKVMWVYRHFPLSFHANAQKEAEASECVYDQGGDTAFWKFIDKIYERTTSNGTGFALEKLGPLAAEVGVNQTKFQSCLDSGKFTKYVTDQQAGGTKAGVNGTPGNLVLNLNNNQVQTIPGAVPFAQIKSVLDGMVK